MTLPQTLVTEARAASINVSQACERGVAAAVADARRQRWLDENRGAIAGWNAYVAEHGLPLARFRQF